jgi:hypothetical protein
MIFPIFTESFVYGKYLVTFPPLLCQRLKSDTLWSRRRATGLTKNSGLARRGRPGVLHGNRTYLLMDADGQIEEGQSLRNLNLACRLAVHGLPVGQRLPRRAPQGR